MPSTYLINNEDLKNISNKTSKGGCTIYLEGTNFHKLEDVENVVKDGVDVTIFTAILQEADAPNRNGRIYTKKAIDEALHRSMVQEKLKHKKWYGENSHPTEQTTERQTKIDRDKVSHIVTDFWWKANILYGRIETANTRAGHDFQGLIRQGSESSFSMRGLGGDSKTKGGYAYIDNNLFIMCYDSVDFPSHEKAYQVDILKEDFSLNTNLLSEEAKMLLNEEKIINVTVDEVNDLIKSRTANQKYFTENDRSILDRFLTSL